MKLRQFMILCTLLVSSLLHAREESITLSRIQLFNDRVEISVPSTFSALHESQLAQFYPERDLPKVVFANADKTVRLAFNFRKNGAEQYKLGAFKDKFFAGWQETDPKLKERSNGLSTVDGQDMGFLGVVHKTPDKHYRFLFFTDYAGMLLTGELICPKKGYKTWEEIGFEIMNSVDIKQ